MGGQERPLVRGLIGACMEQWKHANALYWFKLSQAAGAKWACASVPALELQLVCSASYTANACTAAAAVHCKGNVAVATHA